MNPGFLLAPIILLASGVPHAWGAGEESVKPPKPNELTVVLDPPADEPQPVEDYGSEPDSSATEHSDPAAVKEKQLTGEKPPPADAPADSPEPESSASQRRGVAVRVEKLQVGDGEIDPAEVRLNAPFPAKPLAKPPAGWRLETFDQMQPIVRKVELSAGKSITLKIRPHVLVPVADGTNSFSINEPGFNPSLGYRQDSTVGAILSSSILQLEQDSIALGNAIEKLQQLLVTLPKSEAPPPQARPVEKAPSKPITRDKP